MAVLNITPDSFSDGGDYLAPAAALAQARRLVDEGADILDIGGESTRPGAAKVTTSDELIRVIPVIEAIRRAGINTPISIDTTKAAVARAAIAAGADIVNDVTALCGDDQMATTVAELGVPAILMHMQGTPRTMQNAPRYGSVTAEVTTALGQRVHHAIAHGIHRRALAIDPGIGFGKSVTHNLRLLKGLPQLAALGLPVLVGTSRKSFIGTLLNDAPPTGREWGTAATVAWAVAHGAQMVRVHSVKEMAQVVSIVQAIRQS